MAERSVPYEAALQLPATPEAAAAARDFLRRALRTQQLDGFGEVTELLTSELVTNVIRHVRKSMTVRAIFDGSRIRVEVEDPSPSLPLVMTADVTADHGRGLRIVEQLATAWGAVPHPEGKTVWFELDAGEAHG